MAHYREGVHTVLDRASSLECLFASDLDGEPFGLELMNVRLLGQHIELRNHFWRRLSWQSGALRLALLGRYDVYVFTGDVTVVSTWVCAAIGRLRQRPVLFWTMGWRKPEKGVKRWLRIAFYRLATSLLVYGETGRALGIAHGYPAHRITVIYNSVESGNSIMDCDGSRQRRRGAARATELTVEEPLIVGAVARLTDSKRFDRLIDACALLRDWGKHVRVMLAGDGPARPQLERRARELGVDVRFVGALYDDGSVDDFYEAIDITVLPTAAGLSVIQSLGRGVPVITDDDGSTQGPETEAISAATGSRYVRDNIASLAEAIQEWAGRISRDGAAVAEACRTEYCKRWTAAAHAARIEAAVIDAANSRRRTRKSPHRTERKQQQTQKSGL